MPERESLRFVPRRSVTVTFEGPAKTRYGLISNIGEGGACVWTDAALEVGQRLALSLSLARGLLPVPAEGRVIWIGPEGTAGPGRRYGLQWARIEGQPLDARLRELIAACAANLPIPPFAPGAVPDAREDGVT
jgi:hypothetical protein